MRDTTLYAPLPQHPSFDMHLRARNDLSLTRVSGTGTVGIKQTRGPLKVVVASTGRAVLELPPGPHSVALAGGVAF